MLDIAPSKVGSSYKLVKEALKSQSKSAIKWARDPAGDSEGTEQFKDMTVSQWKAFLSHSQKTDFGNGGVETKKKKKAESDSEDEESDSSIEKPKKKKCSGVSKHSKGKGWLDSDHFDSR